MATPPLPSPIALFDTTLRDGELALKTKLTLAQKLPIAQTLAAMGVAVIEVGYPGAYEKDFAEVQAIAQQVTGPILCGLAGSQPAEIERLAEALKPAQRARINLFTPVHGAGDFSNKHGAVLDVIRDRVSQARHLRDDVQWCAFDATRSDPDFLCRAIEMAIQSGATTISIPDSLGVASPLEFRQLLETVVHRVPGIETVAIAVHCHDDQGLAVENSLVGLDAGVRQIECSINGLGARAGNADLGVLMAAIAQHPQFTTPVDGSYLAALSAQVAQLASQP